MKFGFNLDTNTPKEFTFFLLLLILFVLSHCGCLLQSKFGILKCQMFIFLFSFTLNVFVLVLKTSSKDTFSLAGKSAQNFRYIKFINSTKLSFISLNQTERGDLLWQVILTKKI